MADGTITIQRADDASINLVLTNPDGSAFNATGSTVTFEVRRSVASTPVITKVVSSFSGSDHNLATISLTEEDLSLEVRAWRYELILVDADGNRRTSGSNVLYITQNNGQPNTVAVVVGSTGINVAVTLEQLEPVASENLGITRLIYSISSPTTAGDAATTDYVYLVTGTTTLTLPTAVGNSNRYTVTNTGSGTVTVATTSGQTINGSSSATLPIPKMSLDFISNGLDWIVE